jgi:hypothetical protein
MQSACPSRPATGSNNDRGGLDLVRDVINKQIHSAGIYCT